MNSISRWLFSAWIYEFIPHFVSELAVRVSEMIPWWYLLTMHGRTSWLCGWLIEIYFASSLFFKVDEMFKTYRCSLCWTGGLKNLAGLQVRGGIKSDNCWSYIKEQAMFVIVTWLASVCYTFLVSPSLVGQLFFQANI